MEQQWEFNPLYRISEGRQLGNSQNNSSDFHKYNGYQVPRTIQLAGTTCTLYKNELIFLLKRAIRIYTHNDNEILKMGQP
jgi:hypothetical protein